MLKKALVFALLALAITYSFTALKPRVATRSQAVTSFSIENALDHLKVISRAPHFVGSQEHLNVQDYIVNELKKLGLKVELQEAYSISKWGNLAKPVNILARIEGADNSDKALLLLSHYDSNPHSSLGASDAGSGVVTILEGVRAYLSKNKIPKNDIIILISDAEELGLNGADIFVNEHPWAKDVGLVLNFEARGSGGPSYMLIETNGGNAKLIDAFVKANPEFPVANSLAYSIYKMLPNDTDLTRFREDQNINGFNFAFIDDHYDYHTALDNFDRLDLTSLAHQASYLMPLLNYFADANLNILNSESDHIYFNVPFFKTISYPFAFIFPILVICFLVFVYLVNSGIKNHKLSLNEIKRGIKPLFISLIVNGLIGFLGWKVIIKLYPAYTEILQGFTYNGHLYIWAFSLLALSICFYVYHKVYKPRNAGSLMVAPLALWLVLCLIIAIKLKGASFFIVPVIFGLITLYAHTKQRQPNIYLSGLLTFPLLMIMSPFVVMFPVGLGLKMLALSCVLVTLIFTLTIPIFATFRHKNRWAFLSLTAGFIFLISAHFTSSFNAERPKPNSLVYLYNTDDSTAVWASYDKMLDSWSKTYLTEEPEEANALNRNGLASKYFTNFSYSHKTEAKDVPLPEISVLSDTIIGGLRYLRVYVMPKREIHRVELFADSTNSFNRFIVNGFNLETDELTNTVFGNRKNNRLFSYYIANEPYLDLEFTTPAQQQTVFTFYEASYNLLKNPVFNIKKRSEDMIPKPFVLNDAIIVKTTFSIDP